MGKLGNLLNKDVGALAGKVLKADIGDIAKGAGKILTSDIGSLFGGGAAAPGTAEAAAESGDVEAAVDGARPATGASPARPRAALSEALVTRSTRPWPANSDLTHLLPLLVGEFTRPAAAGQVANDPVTAIYSAPGESVTVTVMVCWDVEEAEREVARHLEKFRDKRVAPDNSWVLGIAQEGVVFAWSRQQYYFHVLSPTGVSPVARFLAEFPH